MNEYKDDNFLLIIMGLDESDVTNWQNWNIVKTMVSEENLSDVVEKMEVLMIQEERQLLYSCALRRLTIYLKAVLIMQS